LRVLVGIDARYGLRREKRGIGCYIYNLLLALAGLDNGVRYVLYVDRTAAPEEVERFSGEPFRVRCLTGGNLFFWEQALLPVAARRDRVDVLHCTSNVAPLFKVCPTVLTVHDVIEFKRAVFGDVDLSLRHRVSRLYRMGILPRIAGRADLVITVSGFSRADIADVLKINPAKIRVTYEGLPSKAPGGGFEELPDKGGTCALGPGGYILALGALDGRKNMKVLLEAFALVKNRFPGELKLVLAGVENIELFAGRVGLEAHPYRRDITCLGFVGDDELVDLYRRCFCFVYPSLYEGFGLPLLEAFAAGVPVVASETTAVGEIAGDAGLLFDPRRPSELAEKILFLLENPEAGREMVDRGHERLKDFSWEKCAAQTLAVYREVAR